VAKSITVVIPAFNEEANVADAIHTVQEAFRGYSDDYEILVVNDGSRDRTGEITEAQAKKDPRVRVVHNEQNSGHAYTLNRGYKSAAKEFVTVFPGDNEISAMYLRTFLQEMGQADLIISYMVSMKNRPVYRRILSNSFVIVLNILFGLRLKCYNGATLYRTKDLRTLDIKSSHGMTILAECLIRLIKSGATYKEVPFDFIGRKGGCSRALRFKNFIECFKVIGILMRDVYFLRKPRQMMPGVIPSDA